MRTFTIALAIMTTLGGTAMARPAMTGKMVDVSSKVHLDQCEVLPNYDIDGTMVGVVSAEQHLEGAVWTLDIDGLLYELSFDGQTAMLSTVRDGLVAGWTIRGRDAVVFDSEGVFEHDGTLSVVAEFYDEVIATLLDPGFLNTLGQDCFAEGERNPWLIAAALAFVASCVDVSTSTTVEYDADGCVVGSSTTTDVGWDCDMPFGTDNGSGPTSESRLER